MWRNGGAVETTARPRFVTKHCNSFQLRPDRLLHGLRRLGRQRMCARDERRRPGHKLAPSDFVVERSGNVTPHVVRRPSARRLAQLRRHQRQTRRWNYPWRQQ